MKLSLFLMLAVFLSMNSYGVEESLLKDPAQIKMISDFYESEGKSDFFQRGDDLKLHYRMFLRESSELTFLILPGRTESASKYDEIIFDLYQLGHSIIVLDWRGQGLSGRMLEDTEKGHITDYEVYVQDLEYFIDNIAMTKKVGRLFPVAHSMGANILSLFLIKRPEVFKKAVLSSPMLDIPAPVSQRGIWLVLKMMEMIGLGDSYVFSHGPWQREEQNRVSGSQLRRLKEVDKKERLPQERIGGATMSWVRASLESTWLMREKADSLVADILMLQAGNDLIVMSEGQDVVCGRAKNCRKILFPNAMHEILNETDEIRQPALEKILEFAKQ